MSGFHIVIYLDVILVLICSKQESMIFFVLPVGSSWLHFPTLNFVSLSTFVSRIGSGNSGYESLPSINDLRYSSWLIPCCRQSVRSCLFWARPNFALMNMHNFTNCAVSFNDMLNVYHSFTYSVHFMFPALCQL